MATTRHPSSYDLPPAMRENRGGVGRRVSFQREMQRAGMSVSDFLELAKRDPTTARTLGEQLKQLIDNGASQEDIKEFFSNQAKGSAIVANIVDGSKDWKSDLAKIRVSVPKAN